MNIHVKVSQEWLALSLLTMRTMLHYHMLAQWLCTQAVSGERQDACALCFPPVFEWFYFIHLIHTTHYSGCLMMWVGFSIFAQATKWKITVSSKIEDHKTVRYRLKVSTDVQVRVKVGVKFIVSSLGENYCEFHFCTFARNNCYRHEAEVLKTQVVTLVEKTYWNPGRKSY